MRTFILISPYTILTSFVLFSCNSQTPVKVLESQYLCAWNGVDSLDFLDSLMCPDEFFALEGPPLVQTLSEVRTIKVVYEISSKRVYFVSADRYRLHFDFCRDVLGFNKSHSLFNMEQYGSGPERLYYLASVSNYSSSGIYTLEFFADDRIFTEGIETVFYAVKKLSYFGQQLRFFPTSTIMKAHSALLPDLPVVSEDQLYGGQRYQPLNPGEAYGWLKKVDMSEMNSVYLGRHDILVVNGIPLDMPVIAGIITTDFQTPLSHINVLSHNRKTPNMALKTAWSDPVIQKLCNKQVHLKVTLDTFSLQEASLADAEKFWRDREPSEPQILPSHDDTSGLFEISQLAHSSTPLVGAKAANFAQLARIKINDDSLPVPEGAFAIPFFYYRQHLTQCGLDKYIDWMLDDSLFRSNYARRFTVLKNLRDSIIGAPLDSAFTGAVKEMIRLKGNFKAIRFRSSTNVEDIEGFNGAGLYESHTAILDDPQKSVSLAIRKVYASLWTMRGFEERDYFKIDQRSAAMGLLVHRSFPHEEANGVAITGNIYFPNVPAYTINVQVKDISVVTPPQGFVADQLLFYTYSSDAFTNPTIEYIVHSNANGGEPVMSGEEIAALAQWLTAIKQHFYYYVYRNYTVPYNLFNMDIEFKLDSESRKLYIKQGRPY